MKQNIIAVLCVLLFFALQLGFLILVDINDEKVYCEAYECTIIKK